MCIIAIKKINSPIPDESILKTMFENNPDGAGFCYNYNGSVFIEKGFMTYKAFLDAINRLKDSIDVNATGMIFHFRIATHGGVNPGLCHPFPLTNKLPCLKRLNTTTNLAVVHNGVIPIKTKGAVSDTMEYIRTKLYHRAKNNPEFYKSKRQRKAILTEISSKMAFLDCDGSVYTVGEFMTDNGIMYSNKSYKERTLDFCLWDDYVKPVMVSPLLEGYIITDNDILDCEMGEYFIDRNGRVYEYDFCFDIATEIKGTAYTINGFYQDLDSGNVMCIDVFK